MTQFNSVEELIQLSKENKKELEQRYKELNEEQEALVKENLKKFGTEALLNIQKKIGDSVSLAVLEGEFHTNISLYNLWVANPRGNYGYLSLDEDFKEELDKLVRANFNQMVEDVLQEYSDIGCVVSANEDKKFYTVSWEPNLIKQYKKSNNLWDKLKNWLIKTP